MDKADERGRNGLGVEIRIRARLDARWASAFPGLAVRVEGPETVLAGRVRDAAELFAVLARVRDLALPLTSVIGLSDERGSQAERGDDRGAGRLGAQGPTRRPPGTS